MMSHAIFLALPALTAGFGNDTTRGLPAGVLFENATDLEIKLRENDALLSDYFEGLSQRNGSLSERNGRCITDMTHYMPACYQICNQWCWATGVAMVSDYYKGQNYCQGFECAVASRGLGRQCCPWRNSCSNNLNDQGGGCNQGGQPNQIVDTVQYFTGGSFTSTGAMSQTDLDNALNSARVVMIGVNWDHGGGHLMVIGGCGSGYYYLHDPFGWYGAMGYQQPSVWQGLTYDQLLRYRAPGGTIGKWTLSIHWSWSKEDEHKHVLLKATETRDKNSFVVV